MLHLDSPPARRGRWSSAASFPSSGTVRHRRPFRVILWGDLVGVANVRTALPRPPQSMILQASPQSSHDPSRQESIVGELASSCRVACFMRERCPKVALVSVARVGAFPPPPAEAGARAHLLLRLLAPRTARHGTYGERWPTCCVSPRIWEGWQVACDVGGGRAAGYPA